MLTVGVTGGAVPWTSTGAPATNTGAPWTVTGAPTMVTAGPGTIAAGRDGQTVQGADCVSQGTPALVQAESATLDWTPPHVLTHDATAVR